MKKVLLDTDIIIDFLRSGKDNLGIFQKIEKKEVLAYISCITSFELYNGALLSANPKQKLEGLARLFESIHIISFDNGQSYVASKVYAYLIKNGISLEIRDILIAGCAISNNLKLSTLNKKHFSRIPELQIF